MRTFRLIRPEGPDQLFHERLSEEAQAQGTSAASRACVLVFGLDTASHRLLVPLLREGKWSLYQFTYQQVQSLTGVESTANHLAKGKADEAIRMVDDDEVVDAEELYLSYLEPQLNKLLDSHTKFQPQPADVATHCVVLDDKFVSCPCEGKLLWSRIHGNIIKVVQPAGGACYQSTVVCVVRVHLFVETYLFIP